MRIQIWKRLLPFDIPMDETVTLEALADLGEWGIGQIRHAISEALQRVAGRTGGNRRVRITDFMEETDDLGDTELELGREVASSESSIPSVTLADVVLPVQLDRDVRQIVAAVSHRSRILDAWGFGTTYRGGQGISALFKGPSGTGKTLTAEAIAGELSRPLRVVTAPNLLSRYVGETDVHVSKLFRTLRGKQDILLIDEAECLLGQRVAAITSTDHYYNTHVNTFLTELDRHPGVVIFSTNLAEHMDKAFDRRIRWKLTFPLPDQEARVDIWRKSIPQEAPLSEDVDFHLLAVRYPISGGLIRNAVLQAAYMAASSDSTICMQDLCKAAAAEDGYRASSKAVIGFSIDAAVH